MPGNMLRATLVTLALVAPFAVACIIPDEPWTEEMEFRNGEAHMEIANDMTREDCLEHDWMLETMWCSTRAGFGCSRDYMVNATQKFMCTAPADAVCYGRPEVCSVPQDDCRWTYVASDAPGASPGWQWVCLGVDTGPMGCGGGGDPIGGEGCETSGN